jgi:hypothetical protein
MTIPRLTEEQAIILSAYTGCLMCDIALLHNEIERRVGRPVFTHMLASPGSLAEVIQPVFRDDFMALTVPPRSAG